MRFVRVEKKCKKIRMPLFRASVPYSLEDIKFAQVQGDTRDPIIIEQQCFNGRIHILLSDIHHR